MVLQTLYGLGGFRSRVLLYCIFWRFAILVGAGGAIHAAEDNGDKACDGCDGAQEGHLRQREYGNQVFRVCCGLECGPFVRREEADVKRKVCHPTYATHNMLWPPSCRRLTVTAKAKPMRMLWTTVDASSGRNRLRIPDTICKAM